MIGKAKLALLAQTVFFGVTLAFGGQFNPPPKVVELRLYEALFRGDSPEQGRGSLLLLLRQKDGRWLPAWGVARDVCSDVHRGRVIEAQLTNKRFSLNLELKLAGLGLKQHAKYEVSLRPAEANLWTGHYTGSVSGVQVKGQAEGEELPPHRQPPDDFKPVKPGEHPRILFRKSELPALRKKMETSLGRAAFKKMNGVIGLAVKYQLTGREKFAEQTIPHIKKMIKRGLLSDQFGHNVGIRLERTAIAYDCLRDVWPEDFKESVEDYLLWAANEVLRANQTAGGGINWHVCSNWSSPLYTGAGFAGLALFGEKGPKPSKPCPTRCGAHIEPAHQYEPGKGVPVFPFRSDRMPEDWICAGGFRLKRGSHDPLADLGGKEEARPEAGDEVTYRGRTVTFKPLSHEKDEGYWQNEHYCDGKLMIDITNAVDRRLFSHNYFYCVVENDRDRWVRFQAGFEPAVLFLNKVPLRQGECAHISKGRYPMLVEAEIGWMNPWGRHLMRPRLVEITAKRAVRCISRAKDRYKASLRDWRSRAKEWNRLNGAALEYMDLLGRSRYMMYRFCREAVGTGGFAAELTHYSGIAERPPARYMAAHRKVFGYSVSSQKDMEVLLPRKMFVHLYPRDGEPWAQEINGTPAISSGLFAALFPVVREEWKQSVLWGWHKHTGATEAGPVTGVLEDNPVLSFLNYPLEMQPKPPAGVFPLTWKAPDFGFYGFRSGWEGKGDFVAQVFLKAHYIGGWNAPNAGTFRLAGLGHVWASGPTDRNRHRWEESVVQLPGNPEINLSACGRLTYVKTWGDGSGIVSINMNDVYAGRRKDERGRGMRLYERYGNIREEEAFADSGISGLRSLGVDYSGISGAPCLFALVDRIKGGGRKIWTWQLPKPDKGNKESKEGSKTAHTEGNMFTVAKAGGATLRGVFVTGQRPEAEVRMTSMKGRAGSSRGKTLKRPVRGVFAEDEEGEFFVVVTVQRGEPPSIKVEGKGLQAKVTVGSRIIRFDDKHIIFERAL